MEEESGKQFQIAGRPTRIANYAIDQTVFVFIILAHQQAGMNINLADLQHASPSLLFYLMMVNTVYYAITEILFSKSLGKLITRTHVVDSEGEKPGFLSIIIRSLCRNLPFEFVSFLIFPLGWHDQLSKTRVVYDSYKEL